MKKILTVLLIIAITATLLCVPAFAMVTESSGDGYELYNGVQLPDINTVWTDKETFPYAFIFWNDARLRYTVALTNFALYHISDAAADRIEGPAYCSWQVYDFSNGLWNLYYYQEFPNDSIVVMCNMLRNDRPVWSNHGIVSVGDGVTYLAASDPISLDSMQVIEWDGDTSDLFAVGNKYTVADYANASNALAVMTTDGVLTASTNFGNSDGVWTVVGSDGTTGYAFANPSEGIGAFKYSDTVYTSLIAYREAETPPEESQPPSGGEGETTGGITSAELEASQAAQTAEIVAKVDSESTIIQAAISSLENALSNSAIFDYLKQSLTFRDFDFETGELSTTSQTYEGIVPLFGHFAQNVEEYLGQLVSVRGSKNEEEVKEETGGFWDLILSLFKRDENTGKADADVEDVNEALKFRDLLNAMFPKDGATDDVITAIGSDENWTFFSDDANSSLNSQVSTFSRRSEPIVDYRSIVYGEYYEKVLGKEWSGD